MLVIVYYWLELSDDGFEFARLVVVCHNQRGTFLFLNIVTLQECVSWDLGRSGYGSVYVAGLVLE